MTVNLYVTWIYASRGHAVAQLVEALRYKPEGRGFDSRWCDRNFSLTLSIRPHYGPGVDSASNRNEYQEFTGGKGGRCLGLTTLNFMCRLSWNMGGSTSWNPLVLSRPVIVLLYLYLLYEFRILYFVEFVWSWRQFFSNLHFSVFFMLFLSLHEKRNVLFVMYLYTEWRRYPLTLGATR
jgi:hypothetical protein